MASIFSVSQVTAYIRNMFTQDFALNRISVRGEVSNCKYHTSGHIYFTLKDGGSQIAAVMFAGQRAGLSFRLEEGQQVVVTGTVDVYERDGRYQLYAREIVREGRGDLFVRFERLRDQLEEMGMFDDCYKQPIPRYGTRIGIVTAGTGAAIRDIMNISARRNPYVQLILYPALVQGEQAPASIAKGIAELDRMGLDLLIVGRGGGSIEDLWAFNEEEVAYAIFHCQTPVISAVGHETDVTIADYVADLRAPTPSAAAELAVFDYRQFEERIEGCRYMLERAVRLRLDQARARLEQDRLRLRLQDPMGKVRDRYQRLSDLSGQLERLMEKKLEEDTHRLALLAGRLDSLSPLKKLRGGYGFVETEGGQALSSVEKAEEGELLKIYLGDGSIRARIEEKKQGW